MPSQAACRGKSQPHEGPCPGSLSLCSTQGRVQPEDVRTAYPVLFPYELPCHAQGWNTAKGGERWGSLAELLSCLTLPCASPVHEEEGKAGAGNARVTGGKADPEGGQVGKILGEGSFTGSWLTWTHCAAVPCLTPLHPTLPPLAATEFLQRSQKNPPCCVFGFWLFSFSFLSNLKN